MGITQKLVTVYSCERCEHSWIPRGAITGEEETPLVCPKCKSPYWNRPRQGEEPTPVPKKRVRKKT